MAWEAMKSLLTAMCLSAILLLASAGASSDLDSDAECGVEVSLPTVLLTGVPFVINVTLPPFLPDNETIPLQVWIGMDGVECNGVNSTVTRDDNGTAMLTSLLPGCTVNYTGYHNLAFNISRDSDTANLDQLICLPIEKTVLSIPGILTLIAPLVTAVLAIVFRQVMLALIIGIWICASFANEYNPLEGILRTLDSYLVGSLASPSHAAIVVFSFFLGGLIGVVQKSGGGIGLARLLYRFTNSRRKATVVCVTLCFLIFFDDYSAVLIPGNSLRSVMHEAGVSKEKFAYILQSVGPALASIVPISSWIGVQVGYVHSSFSAAVCNVPCTDNSTQTNDAFIMVIETIPYRFFPLLMLFCVVLVSFLGRDMGPMLTVERNVLDNVVVNEQDNGNKLRSRTLTTSDEDSDEDLYSGPLAPKKGVPYRWFNAAVPFAITVVFTLLGMVLGGRQAILDQPPSKEEVEMNILNIFKMADSLSALIWASCLATVVLFLMLRLQKILKLSEFMEAWIEGIKDILEPLLILLLAWALGAAIQDTQTNSYIALVLHNGNISAQYIPVIVTVIGFVLSFATGSAYGTMGLLFPLVIPTVCQLAPCDHSQALQATAAILSSSLFGNAISPIADITILATAATKCELVPHIKTSILYVFLVGIISLLFGSLPVGAGWYDWYVAWLLMPAILVLIFVVFSTSITSSTSRSLGYIVCPCIYTFPNYLWRQLRSSCTKCTRKWRNQNEPVVGGAAEDERAPLLPLEPDKPEAV